MNSKKELFEKAENLYIFSFASVEETAQKLKLSRKTITRWKEKGNWDVKKAEFLKTKELFHRELYEFARKMMHEMSADMDAGEEVNQSKLYSFCKICSMFPKVKDYEDNIFKADKKSPTGLTPEAIREIEENILGIKYDDDEE